MNDNIHLHRLGDSQKIQSPKEPRANPFSLVRNRNLKILLTPFATERRTTRCTQTATWLLPLFKPLDTIHSESSHEHARIASINLDDYQHVPVTPPPSPSFPPRMPALQRMIANKSHPPKEKSSNYCPTHTVDGEMDEIVPYCCNPTISLTTCLEELADLMTLWNVESQVEVDQWETPSMDELITHFRQIVRMLRIMLETSEKA
ncbi:hypothetical protein Tco_0921333 [Tanacetum coccineum]